MGVLRLLYCDSAGVRRCRAVVYKGELPTAKEDAHCNAQASAAHTLLAAAAADGVLETTPSIAEAAYAGIIPWRPPHPADEAEQKQDQETDLQPSQQQEQQQQQQQTKQLQELAAALGVAPAADAGPFASKQAAQAAAEDGSFSSQLPLGSSFSGLSQPLLSQASSTRLLQPLTPEQVEAVKVAVPYATGLTKGTMGSPAVADTVLPGSGLSAVGEVLLVPDLSAVQQLPWAEGHSIAPVDMMERDLSKPFVGCPRSALKQALAALRLAHGIRLMVGFELEFMLLKPAPAAGAGAGCGPGGHAGLTVQCGSSSFVPFDESIYCQSSSLDQAAPILDKMVAALESMGIGVQQYHAESAPGQFEIATKHFPALQAADKLLLSKEAISAVARQAGLEVTFLPKPLHGYAGSGCHCHLSLWKAERSSRSSSSSSVEPCCLMTEKPGSSSSSNSNTALSTGANPTPHSVPGYPTLSGTAAAFLAGLLGHLPALLPFTAPSENSYARLKPGTWSGATACWGWDNREAPLRLCCPDATQPDSCNIEYKPFDGTANPYIGLAAIVAAGMRGLQESAALPAPVQVEPSAALAAAPDSTAPAAATAALQQLPGSLGEALTVLQADTSLQAKLQQLLGPDLLTAFLAVRSYEAAHQTAVDKLLLRY